MGSPQHINDFSQSGEQEILVSVFGLLPPSIERWCVEFGAWDGKHLSNTYHLISQLNWNAVLIEQDPTKFELLKASYAQNTRVALLNKTVNFEGEDTLDNLLSTLPIPLNFDLLSIDIDGNDWHVWDTVKKYRPKVVVIEFNPTIPSDVEFVQPKNLSINQGTSLLYIVNRAREKGYELINTSSCNAFFIQKQLFPLLNMADNSIQNLWKTENPAPRLFQLYDGTLVLDKEYKMRWRKKTIGKLDLQIIPQAERIYQPAQTLKINKKDIYEQYNFLQNSIGVIHIGASSGQERAIYQKYDIPVLWVEALPAVFESLQQNIADFPKQRALQALLLDVLDEELTFYVSSNQAKSSSIYPLGEHKKMWPRVEYIFEAKLRSETLTNIVLKQNIDLTNFDTIVIDTQGSELRALKGGAELLWGIHTIYVETSDCELYTGGCLDSEITAFLKPFGFVEIDRMIMKKLPEIGSCYNVLYQKPIFINPKKPLEKKPIRNIHRKEGLRNLRKTLNNFGLPPSQFQTQDAEINHIIKQLKPYNSGHSLLRLGPNGDGGYLVPDDLTGIEACYSPGIGQVMGFEEDCLKHGMRVFVADKSVEGIAKIPTEFNYSAKYLGKETEGDFVSLQDWVNSTFTTDSKDLLLQMDIEGFEYDTLTGVPQALLNRFRILVLELHFLELMVYKPTFDKIASIIKLLTTNHTVVHLHPNNCCGTFEKDMLSIPRTLEVTLLRNDRLLERKPVSLFPHHLDKENTPKPPLVLPYSWYNEKNAPGKIKAIVLTYDRNHIITEHMIRCYQNVWPNNPFVFHIPYQDPETRVPAHNKVYIKTPVSFRATVLGLLENLPAEEWVYWCIDDKYPIKINTSVFEYVFNSLQTFPSNIASILLCRTKKLLLEENVREFYFSQLQIDVLERITLHQFWAHQFIRVKTLRRIFNAMPDTIEMPTDMVKHLHKTQILDSEKLLVSKVNNIVFGESTAKRVLTENCRISLEENGFPMPPFYNGETSKPHFIGSMD